MKPIYYKCVYAITFFGFVLFNVFFTVVTIKSSSMKPTLSEGDLLLMRRNFTFHPHNVDRGQIVMFMHPMRGLLIKRVIGLPGDMIVISNKTIYIKKANTPSIIEITNTLISHGVHDQDGYPLSVYQTTIDGRVFNVAITGVIPERIEHFYSHDDLPAGQFAVPDNKLFVMGDNRDFSMDSRFFGFVDFEHVIAINATR